MSEKAFYTEKQAAKIFKELEKRSLIPTLEITAKSVDNKHLSLISSKFGGYPYWPKGREYPVSKENETKLVLLAQINFSELPHLEDFPEKGILQFFINTDEPYGCDFGNIEQNDWRVIFHEDTNDALTEDELADMGVKTSLNIKADDSYFPFDTEFELSFEKKEQFINMHCEGRFEKAVREIARDLKLAVPDETLTAYDIFEESILDDFDKKCGAGHRIGGYPFFTQFDPRKEDDDYDILLLQIDSQTATEGKKDDILWGDMGIANFFITKEDLKKRDFSKVLYNWDCY